MSDNLIKRLRGSMSLEATQSSAPMLTELSISEEPSDLCLEAADRITELEAERDSLFDAIAHGDQEHRDWLKQAIADHFAGRPVQRPQGKGTRDSIRDKALEEAAVCAKKHGSTPGRELAETIRALKGRK